MKYKFHDQESIINFTVPSISVEITDESSNGSIEGQNNTFKCTVSGVETLSNVVIIYEWTRESITVLMEDTYIFTPKVEDDGIIFNCEATVNSSLLNSTIIRNESITLSVLGM